MQFVFIFVFVFLFIQRIQAFKFSTNIRHMFSVLGRSLTRSLGNRFDEKVIQTIPPINPLTLYQRMYDLKWYVVGVPADFSMKRPTKTTVWSKDYAVWKTGPATYTAVSNACPHRGAALSDGTITRDACITCPYHGYHFDEDGSLVEVPGVELSKNINSYNAERFDVVEDGGWVYLNTFSYRIYNVSRGTLSNNLAEDAERNWNFSCITMQMDYAASPRIVTENGLDISHIGFVHSFGNRESPNPIDEVGPRQIEPNRFQTKYRYEAGPQSMTKVLFGQDRLNVENEFVLPHQSVARIKFDRYVNTIITFATPVSHNRTRLFVKNYRNFWRNMVGDWFIRATMFQTMNEDRRILEQIYEEEKDGKFNMRYDKMANTYRVLYEKEYGQWPKL